MGMKKNSLVVEVHTSKICMDNHTVISPQLKEECNICAQKRENLKLSCAKKSKT